AAPARDAEFAFVPVEARSSPAFVASRACNRCLGLTCRSAATAANSGRFGSSPPLEADNVASLVHGRGGGLVADGEQRDQPVSGSGRREQVLVGRANDGRLDRVLTGRLTRSVIRRRGRSRSPPT